MKPTCIQRGDKRRLGVAHGAQQLQIRLLPASEFGKVPLDDVISQLSYAIDVIARGEELEGADANEARGDPRQDRPGQGALAIDGFAGGHCRERARGGNSKRMHGLADQIFAQHGTEGSASVAVPRIRGPAGALELNIAAHPGLVEGFSQQDRATVAELRHEMPELMARIGHGDRLDGRRKDISGVNSRQRAVIETGGIEPEVRSQRVIECQQARHCDRRRRHACKKALRESGISIAFHGCVELIVRWHR